MSPETPDSPTSSPRESLVLFYGMVRTMTSTGYPGPYGTHRDQITEFFMYPPPHTDLLC